MHAFSNQIIASSLKTNVHVNGNYSSNGLNFNPLIVKGANVGVDFA
jgi:hypothetical protein